MISNTLVTISSIEEGEIDRDRIVDGDVVPNEYFCPICQYVLWKPRSCSSCQNIFCEKCIRTWIENANSGGKCPFRCQSFEERRCPPYVQSLLSRLNIHCRNSEFGCEQILPYDQLEHHENIQCKYLSQRCLECEKLILVSKFDEHRQFAGLCVPSPIKCTICQNYIEKCFFREHFHQFCQERINQLNRLASFHRNLQTFLTGQAIRADYGQTYFETISNTIQLVEQQKEMSRLPTSLKGVDAVKRAREQNCGHVYHILIMLKFILLNWSKIPYFIFTFSTAGFFVIGTIILGGYLIFSHWVYTHVYRGVFCLILLTFLLTCVSSIFFEFVSDWMMIFCFGMFIFLWGCSSRVSLETLEMDGLFNKTTLSIVFCCIGIFVMKIILLLIRFYYWSMPTYNAAGLLTFINLYLSFKAHLIYENTITTRINQLMMPV